MATIQERLRLLAPVLRKQPRMMHHGVFVDELLVAAADEIQQKADLILSLGQRISELDQNKEVAHDPKDDIVCRLKDWPMCEWNAVIQLRKDAAAHITKLLAQIAALEWYAEVTAEQAVKTKDRLERMVAIREKEL